MRRFYEGRNYYITYDNPMKSGFSMHDEVMVTHIDVAGNLRVRGVRGNSEQVATLYPSQLTHEEPPGRRRTPRRNSPEAMPDNVSDDEIFTYKLKRMGL